MADDGAVWTATEAKVEPSRPNVIDLATRAVSEASKQPGGFLLAGLWPTIIGLVLGVGSVLVAYGFFFAGMVPGLLSDDPDQNFLIGFGLGFGVLIPTLSLTILLMTPMVASLHRAVWGYLVRGEPLSMSSAFSTYGQDLGKVIGFNLVYALAMFAGVLLCYVPALIISALFVFAGPAIYIHRLSIGEAIGLSIRSAQEQPGWHLAFFGVSFVILLVLQYVPIVGMMLIYTAHPLFVLLAYRELFGTDELPRGYGA